MLLSQPQMALKTMGRGSFSWALRHLKNVAVSAPPPLGMPLFGNLCPRKITAHCASALAAFTTNAPLVMGGREPWCQCFPPFPWSASLPCHHEHKPGKEQLPHERELNSKVPWKSLMDRSCLTGKWEEHPSQRYSPSTLEKEPSQISLMFLFKFSLELSLGSLHAMQVQRQFGNMEMTLLSLLLQTVNEESIV